MHAVSTRSVPTGATTPWASSRAGFATASGTSWVRTETASIDDHSGGTDDLRALCKSCDPDSPRDKWNPGADSPATRVQTPPQACHHNEWGDGRATVPPDGGAGGQGKRRGLSPCFHDYVTFIGAFHACLVNKTSKCAAAGVATLTHTPPADRSPRRANPSGAPPPCHEPGRLPPPPLQRHPPDRTRPPKGPILLVLQASMRRRWPRAATAPRLQTPRCSAAARSSSLSRSKRASLRDHRTAQPRENFGLQHLEEPQKRKVKQEEARSKACI